MSLGPCVAETIATRATKSYTFMAAAATLLANGLGWPTVIVVALQRVDCEDVMLSVTFSFFLYIFLVFCHNK